MARSPLLLTRNLRIVSMLKTISESTLKFDVHLTLDHWTSPVEFEFDSANSDVAPACNNIYADVRKFPSWIIFCVSSCKLV